MKVLGKHSDERTNICAQCITEENLVQVEGDSKNAQIRLASDKLSKFLVTEHQ